MSQNITEETSVSDLLKLWKLHNRKTKDKVLISERLDEEGYENLNDFAEIDVNKLTSLNIKKLQAERLYKNIQSAFNNLKVKVDELSSINKLSKGVSNNNNNNNIPESPNLKLKKEDTLEDNKIKEIESSDIMEPTHSRKLSTNKIPDIPVVIKKEIKKEIKEEKKEDLPDLLADIEIDVNLDQSMNINKTSMKKKMLNPYVIIIGISDYSEGYPDKSKNLNSAKKDVKLLVHLFKEVFKYKYVYYIIDKIESETIDEDNLDEYLDHHRSNIRKINKKMRKNNNKNLIDGLIVCYSGHGNDKNLVLGNKEMDTYPYETLKKIYDNKNFSELRTKPKLFCLDCCHGSGIIKPISHFEQVIIEETSPFSHVSTESRTINKVVLKKTKITEHQDTFKLWGSVKGYESFGDPEGYGNLTRSLFVTFKKLLSETNDISQGISLQTSVPYINKCVRDFSDNHQTSQTESTLDYDLIIVPASSQPKKVIPKIDLNKDPIKLELEIKEDSGHHRNKVTSNLLVEGITSTYWSPMDGNINHWVIFNTKDDKAFYKLNNIIIRNCMTEKAVKNVIIYTNNNLDNIKDNNNETNNNYTLKQEISHESDFESETIELIADEKNSITKHNLIKVYFTDNYGATSRSKISFYYFGCKGIVDDENNSKNNKN